jgi:hypothetical protein
MAQAIVIYQSGWDKLGAQLWLRGLMDRHRLQIEVLAERFQVAEESLALGEVDYEAIEAAMPKHLIVLPN